MTVSGERRQQVTALAQAIREAWNTSPWRCNLPAEQQMVMSRLAAEVAVPQEVSHGS